MALAYTAPTWVDGSGEGLSASNLQAISNCIEGLVQGSDKAIHNIAINNGVMTITYVDGTVDTDIAVNLKGISNIAKTGTSGLVDTYTVTYTDGSTFTFTVTNGRDGAAVVEVSHTGTASASAARKQIITVDEVSTDIDGSVYMETTTKTTSSGTDTFTFTGIEDASNKVFDFYCDKFGVAPTGVTISGTSVAVAFASSDSVSKCRIYIRG
jgi:hypothetical protein